MENENYKELIEVFSFLHDGLIEKIEFNNKSIKLSVIIDFYTHYIREDFRYLFVFIDNISELEYMDWTDNMEIYSDISILIDFAQDLWIVNTKNSSNNRIEINCHGGKSNNTISCGGSLLFNFSNYCIHGYSGDIDPLFRSC